MKRIIVASLVFVFATGAFGHTPWASGAEIKPASAALAPMPRPTLPLGTVLTWKWRSGRVDFSHTLVASDEATVTFKSNRGCMYTMDSHIDFMGGPVHSLKWTNCRRSSGTGSIKVIEGEIWPLKVGRKWRYSVKGSRDSGRSWSYQMDCEVKNQVRVSVPAGSFDTYYIFCETEYVKRKYYISPVLKTNVLHEWEHKTKFRDISRELISYKSGKAE